MRLALTRCFSVCGGWCICVVQVVVEATTCTDFMFFNKLAKIGGNLIIQKNVNLTVISGLRRLGFVGGCVTLPIVTCVQWVRAWLPMACV